MSSGSRYAHTELEANSFRQEIKHFLLPRFLPKITRSFMLHYQVSQIMPVYGKISIEIVRIQTQFTAKMKYYILLASYPKSRAAIDNVTLPTVPNNAVISKNFDRKRKNTKSIY